MKDRLLKFLTNEEISATKFADEIGVQRSSISHILSGRNKPSYDFIQKILTRYPILNSDWLILGKGKMYKTDQPENATTNNSNKINLQADLFSSLAEQNDKTEEISPEKPNQEPDNTLKSEYSHKKPSDDLKEELPLTYKSEKKDVKVEQVVIFYSDGTFKAFKPQE